MVCMLRSHDLAPEEVAFLRGLAVCGKIHHNRLLTTGTALDPIREAALLASNSAKGWKGMCVDFANYCARIQHKQHLTGSYKNN